MKPALYMAEELKKLSELLSDRTNRGISMIKLLKITFAASLLVFMAPASALEVEGMVTGGHDANMTTSASGLSRSDFTFFPTPTAWDPGVNTARNGGHPAPGGATFSIMGAGLVDVTGFDSHGGAPTQTFTGASYAGFSNAIVGAIASAALDIWASVSGFTNLGQVADGGFNSGAAEPGGAIGDIRIAAWSGFGAGVLAHAFQPGNESIFGAGGAVAGDTHFNSAFTWVDDANDVTGNGVFDLFTVMLHELGHALGLGHTNVANSVMNPFYAGANRTLGADDIAGIQALYGAPEVTGVPEPATLWLFGMGLIALGWSRRLRS